MGVPLIQWPERCLRPSYPHLSGARSPSVSAIECGAVEVFFAQALTRIFNTWGADFAGRLNARQAPPPRTPRNFSRLVP